MICEKCGKEFLDDGTGCPECKKNATFAGYKDETTVSKDSNSSGWFFLGLFLPIIGFIIYLVIRHTKQNASTRLFMGFGVGVLFRILLYYTWIFLI